MNVTTQVLCNALSGSSEDTAAVVAASSVAMARYEQTGQGSSYVQALETAYHTSGGDPVHQGSHMLAQAVHDAGSGLHGNVVSLAAQGNQVAQDAVRQTMEANPQLSHLAS